MFRVPCYFRGTVSYLTVTIWFVNNPVERTRGTFQNIFPASINSCLSQFEITYGQYFVAARNRCKGKSHWNHTEISHCKHHTTALRQLEKCRTPWISSLWNLKFAICRLRKWAPRRTIARCPVGVQNCAKLWEISSNLFKTPSILCNYYQLPLNFTRSSFASRLLRNNLWWSDLLSTTDFTVPSPVSQISLYIPYFSLCLQQLQSPSMITHFSNGMSIIFPPFTTPCKANS